MFEFIFHSFWTFVGTAILLGILLEGIAAIVLAAKGIKSDDSSDTDKK